MMTVEQLENEFWRPVQVDAFVDIYEISNHGRVRFKPYKFYKDGKLHKSEGRLLEFIDRDVFLTNGTYRGLYKVGTLYNKTFPNTRLDEQRR